MKVYFNDLDTNMGGLGAKEVFRGGRVSQFSWMVNMSVWKNL